MREDLGHVKEIRNALDSKDSAAAERSIKNLVAACEGSRVRTGSFRSGLGTARLYDDNWFLEGDSTSGREERARVSYGFDVEQNTVRVGVFPKVVDQVAPSYVQHRTGGDDAAEPDFLFEAPV